MFNRERVCTRVGVNQERRRVAAIHVCSGSIVSGTNLDAADVAHPCHPSLLIGFDDNVTELLGCGKPAECLNVDLISLVSWSWRLIQNPSRDLQVLGAQCREHLTAVAIVRRNLVGFEPHADVFLAPPPKLPTSHTSTPPA